MIMSIIPIIFSIYTYIMLNEEITKTEIKRIVNDEMKKVINDELQKQLSSLLKRGSGKDEIKSAVKTSLNNLYKFMWTKRNQWNNEL
jgi:hypothetical protein